MPKQKIGRNDPCWCGSGIKYKKCHLGRATEEPIKTWKADEELRSNFSRRCCSAPSSWQKECSDKIIKAHTVPRATTLKAIARDGHVYAVVPTLSNIAKANGRATLSLLGINKASTFSGFCSTHDDQIFSPIEKSNFSPTPEHCFLLAYRAFSRENYTKSAMLQTNNLLKQLDRGRNTESQMKIQAQAFMNWIGVSAGVRDNEVQKNLMVQMLEASDFSATRAVVFELDRIQPIMAAGGINPTHDFDGNRIQDLSQLEVVPEMLTVTSFCSDERGYIAFVWIGRSTGICDHLIQSFLRKPSDQQTAFAMQFVLKSFENVFINPSWWESLNSAEKNFVTDLINDSVNPFSDFNDTGLRSVMLPRNLPSAVKIHTVNLG